MLIMSSTFLLVLRNERLYANIKKCTFCTDKLVFLGFVVSSNGIDFNESKFEAIKNWPIPTTVGQVRGFYGHRILSTFCERF